MLPDEQGPNPDDSDDDAVGRLLSAARTALFMIDLIAVQQFLERRRLISPEVEAILVQWMAAHAEALSTLAEDLPALVVKEPVAIEAAAAAVDAMLDEFVTRLPLPATLVDEPVVLSHAS